MEPSNTSPSGSVLVRVAPIPNSNSLESAVVVPATLSTLAVRAHQVARPRIPTFHCGWAAVGLGAVIIFGGVCVAIAPGKNSDNLWKMFVLWAALAGSYVLCCSCALCMTYFPGRKVVFLRGLSIFELE